MMRPDGRTEAVRPFRIGVRLKDSPLFKPLLHVAVSRDGGVMATPPGVPVVGWVYGIAEAPSGRYADLPGRVVGRTAVRIAERPKLHYHLSGWTSVNLTGHPAAPRRGVRCLPIDRVRGEQCFSLNVQSPETIPSAGLRVRDMALFVPEWPADVQVHGLLYGRDQIPGMGVDFGGAGAFGMVRSDAAELVVDLQGHGVDAALVVRFTWTPGPAPPGTAPGASLFGLDYRATHADSISDCVGIWSEGTPALPVQLLAPWDLPRFRYAPGGVTLDRHRVTRSADGAVVESEQF